MINDANVQEYFCDLSKVLFRALLKDEVAVASFKGEDSSFVRVNKGRVRQAGDVSRAWMLLELILDGDGGPRSADACVDLSMQFGQDLDKLRGVMWTVREAARLLPKDPYLAYCTDVGESQVSIHGTAPEPHDAVDEWLDMAGGMDLVGLYTSGPMWEGFISSTGKRDWHYSDTFCLSWTCYGGGDKAVKSSYAGNKWDEEELWQKMDDSRKSLEILKRPPVTVEKGKYRAFLEPAAVHELAYCILSGAFGLEAKRTKGSILTKMVDGKASLSDKLTIREATRDNGLAAWGARGFPKPPSVTLLERGEMRESLVSPRSAEEYEEDCNGADGDECSGAMDIESGGLAWEDALDALEEGIKVSNLWYLNVSDNDEARITGMTRFATTWVEDGEEVAPLSVMRFDDTLYRMLGENLEDLTIERETIADDSTYYMRSPLKYVLPGMLLGELDLTL
jgi:predicted Zn-dependent protease